MNGGRNGTAAPIAALREEDLAGYLNRTRMLLGDDALTLLATKTVAVAGCGGVGGAVAMTLARMGVGGFAVADPADFDAPDINRQWAATHATLGQNKAATYADVLRTIQPAVRLATFTEGVTEANLGAFLDGADVVVDCLDVAVPPQLRVALYQQARARGLHCLCAPMLGFGAILVDAAPDGMPMEALYGPVFAQAVATSTLPPGLRDLVVPEHIDAIERHLRALKAPSVAISPMLSAALMSTEIALILLGEGFPGWRPPHALPDVMVVDPIRGTFRVLPLTDLVAAAPPGAPPAAAPAAGADGAAAAVVDAAAPPDARRAALAAAGHNPLRLPPAAIAVDLLSDSWRERALPPDATSAGEAPGSASATAATDVAARLRDHYGLAHTVVVPRGRLAEAVLARAAVRPGTTVVANALFPTTRHHLEAAGARVVEVGIPEADDPYDPHPFKAELDLAALDRALADGADRRAVYVELCANALGGQPVRLAHLRAVRDLAAARGVPLYVDVTRAYENAALVRAREPGQAGRPLGAIVRDLCACATAVVGGLSKDFVTPVGGFVGTDDGALGAALRDEAVLALGVDLDAGGAATLAAALAAPAVDDAVEARLQTVRRLHDALAAAHVPVVFPPGGHAVCVDVAAWLPHLGPRDHRSLAAAHALYVAGGIRAGAHLGTPRQAAQGVELLRLAVPVGGLDDAAVERVADTFRWVHGERSTMHAWRRDGDAGGMVGAMMGAYVPAGRPR